MQTWIDAVPLLQSGYHQELLAKVDEIRQTRTVYPPRERIFYALETTPFPDVQIVITGQDPYHGPDQAHGLAFSVPEEIKSPPSLRNIFKEIINDVYVGQAQEFSSDLTRWAKQGVLLLNATLSVEAGKAASHKKLGWSDLTDQIIEILNQKRENLVFILWGRHAQSKKPLIDIERHLVLESVHPSPLSARRGFFGCKHFSQANEYRVKHGGRPIQW